MGKLASQSVALNMVELARLLQLLNSSSSHARIPRSGLGSPGPLGLTAFGLTNFVLSTFNAGVFIAPKFISVLIPLALVVGGFLQFIAGLYEFRIPNTFAATAFCSYGGFFFSLGLYEWFFFPIVEATDPSGAHEPLGLFVLAWTIFTIYFVVAAWAVSVIAFLLYLNVFLAFAVVSIGTLAQSNNTVRVGGWIGFGISVFAFYGAGAVLTNSTFGKQIFPLGIYDKTRQLGRA